jgi:hypothetical protein
MWKPLLRKEKYKEVLKNSVPLYLWLNREWGQAGQAILIWIFTSALSRLYQVRWKLFHAVPCLSLL